MPESSPRGLESSWVFCPSTQKSLSPRKVEDRNSSWTDSPWALDLGATARKRSHLLGATSEFKFSHRQGRKKTHPDIDLWIQADLSSIEWSFNGDNRLPDYGPRLVVVTTGTSTVFLPLHVKKPTSALVWGKSWYLWPPLSCSAACYGHRLISKLLYQDYLLSWSACRKTTGRLMPQVKTQPMS